MLLFTRTAAFHHDSIPAAVTALQAAAPARHFNVEVSEDAASFTDANLARFAAVVFLMTTGDVLDDAQQAAFERYVSAGGGFAGVHSASDTEYDWSFYGTLLGTWFSSHPPIQTGHVAVVDRQHPSTRDLPAAWVRADEWYGFRTNPRDSVHVLATVDESTYDGGGMGADHPIAWCHVMGAARSWYTAMGHADSAWQEPLFLAHVLGGLAYVAGLEAGDCT